MRIRTYGVEQRVDPPYPREPGVHVADGKHESSVDDDSKHQDTRERHGLRNGLRDGRHGSEDGCHYERGHVGDCGSLVSPLISNELWKKMELTQKEDEELRGFPAKVSHEVDDQIEAHGLCKLQRNVDNDASDCLSQMLVKCKTASLSGQLTGTGDYQRLPNMTQVICPLRWRNAVR
jgi:hypothetical protein